MRWRPRLVSATAPFEIARLVAGIDAPFGVIVTAPLPDAELPPLRAALAQLLDRPHRVEPGEALGIRPAPAPVAATLVDAAGRRYSLHAPVHVIGGDIAVPGVVAPGAIAWHGPDAQWRVGTPVTVRRRGEIVLHGPDGVALLPGDNLRVPDATILFLG